MFSKLLENKTIGNKHTLIDLQYCDTIIFLKY